MVQVQCCKRDIINEMGIRAKRTCPCWESRGSQAVGQSGRQGHGAPGKVKKLWRMLWHKKTGRNYRSLIQLSKFFFCFRKTYVSPFLPHSGWSEWYQYHLFEWSSWGCPSIGCIVTGKRPKKDITINTKTYLNVRYGSILVHYHEVWPPRRMGRFFKHISIIKFTCSYPAHQCHPKETQHMCPDEDENEARLLYHQISTSSPITPINFPLAELRAMLLFKIWNEI